MNRNRLTTLAALLALAAPATARAQSSFWDFVALNGAPAAPANWPTGQVTYSSRTVTNPGYGSATFTGTLNTAIPGNPLVVFQWYPDQFGPLDEKGVALCRNSPGDLPAPCYTGGEIGESNDTKWLRLDLTALTAGSILNSVTLTSLSFVESYLFQVCLDSGFSVCNTYTGAATGSGAPGVYTIAMNPADQGSQYLQFGKGLTGGDYAVQGITTTVPEPGTMGLLATGLVALMGAGTLRRRNRNKNKK
jgi:hypothetical protein